MVSHKRRIFVVGPILPFTGGIAQSNTVLCTNLAKSNDVTAISYSMMYPALLYPGKSQKSGTSLKNPPFKQIFVLNTLNPISWFRVVNRVRKEKPNWVVFQWWHTYFFPAYFFISRFSKLFGAKVNFVCHNVLPHEDSIAKKVIHAPLTKILLKTATHVTTLSSSELAIAKKLVPHAKADFIFENSFVAVTNRRIISKATALSKLHLQKEKTLLFFGAVRPYKGLEDLIEAVKILSEKEIKVNLVVAGAFWEPVEKYRALAEKFGISKHVFFFNKYISDEEVPVFFAASDLLVLSHRSATQSAVPQLAFIHNLPMVATSVSGNAPFVDEGKTGFLVPPNNPEKMAFAIKKFFDLRLSASFSKKMKSKVKMFEWSEEKEKKFFGED